MNWTRIEGCLLAQLFCQIRLWVESVCRERIFAWGRCCRVDDDFQLGFLSVTGVWGRIRERVNDDRGCFRCWSGLGDLLWSWGPWPVSFRPDTQPGLLHQFARLRRVRVSRRPSRSLSRGGRISRPGRPRVKRGSLEPLWPWHGHEVLLWRGYVFLWSDGGLVASWAGCWW